MIPDDPLRAASRQRIATVAVRHEGHATVLDGYADGSSFLDNLGECAKLDEVHKQWLEIDSVAGNQITGQHDAPAWLGESAQHEQRPAEE